MSYFLSPKKVLFGKGMLKRLGAELEGRGNKAVLITDKNLVKLSEELVAAVKAAGYEVRVWAEAEPEPSIAVTGQGRQAPEEFAPQLVIGFGGGSVLDTAKAAWVLWENPAIAAADIATGGNVGAKPSWQRKARVM